MSLSHRIEALADSETIKMAQMTRDMKAQGLDASDLTLGEPDFDTPAHIKEAAIEAIRGGYTKYTPVPGYPELREAVCYKMKRDNGLDFTPEQIVVSTGAKQAIANAVLSLINPGDEVIIPAPFWVSYSAIVQLAEGKSVVLPTRLEDNFILKAEDLEKAISPKTRMFIFSSPCNPTGSIYSREDLAALVKVFEKYPDIIILADEIYEYIRFGGEHASIAQFPSMRERTIIVNGCSKGYAMTGWRIGYIAAPLSIARACNKMQTQFTSGTCSIAQKAAVAALRGSNEEAMRMRDAFQQRRDFVRTELMKIDGLKVNEPQGAFYFFPDVSAFFGRTHNGKRIDNADDLSMYLLKEGLVSSVNGAAFGAPDCIRLSYSTSMEKLAIAMQRLQKAFAQLQ